jgi:hypothetical protein
MIKCIITTIGSILIGKVSIEDSNGIILSEPREVQIMQVASNQTKFAVLYIFGRPKVVSIPTKSIMLHYELTDPSILSIYEEHVNQIKRAKPGEIEALVNKSRH